MDQHDPTGRALSARLCVLAISLACMAVCCMSLVVASERYAIFDISYDTSRVWSAIAAVAAVGLVLSIVFASAEFSFGYLVAFYLSVPVVGFVWLSYFTSFPYDHRAARWSAILSAISFVIPATMLRPRATLLQLDPAIFRRVPDALLLLSILVLLSALPYGFKFASLETASAARNSLVQPRILVYAIGLTTGALLPFSFGYYWITHAWLKGLSTLLLLAAFYTVTLSKLVLLSPLFMLFMLGLYLLAMVADLRLVAMLGLLLPALIGIASLGLLQNYPAAVFTLFNFRMLSIPASALDHYNDFFSTHPTTGFCQIMLIKSVLGCVYEQPLSIVMANSYGLGNFNASLFATEGIASVGIRFSPISAFLCGLIIALGNAASSRLPSEFILASSVSLIVSLMNVPLSTAMLTNGGGVLFLLWAIFPRSSHKAPNTAVPN